MKKIVLDQEDKKILAMLESNARMSYTEIGKELEMTRMAAKKRVEKLEKNGIIRGYNTCIYRDEDITLFIDITTQPGKYEKVLKYVSTETAYVRQIFRTSREDHIHMVAVSDSFDNLKYLKEMIQKKCGKDIADMQSYAVTEVIKDVYGGVRYEDRTKHDDDGNNESTGRRKAERETWK